MSEDEQAKKYSCNWCGEKFYTQHLHQLHIDQCDKWVKLGNRRKDNG